MTYPKKLLLAAICAASCAIPFGASTAQAQLLLEEIIVTAQKREQNLQDVGISVTAFSDEQIQKLGFSNSTDIVAQTPNVTLSSFHASLTNLNIRGISQNDFADQLEAPNAVYVDEAYVTSMGMASTQIFDLQRIEVLRGPQGTLFGRNATGGLVHYISNKPTREFEGYAQVTGGDFGLFEADGAVSGPLGDAISGRLALSVRQDDGYLENRLGDDVRDNDYWGVRGQLLFDLGDKGELLLKGHYAKDDTNGNAYTHQAAVANPSSWLGPLDPDLVPADGLVRAVPANVDIYGTCPGCDLGGYRDPDGNPHKESLGSLGFDNPEGNDPFFEREVRGFTAKLTYEIGEMTLTSVTDLLKMEKDYREDSDGSPIFGSLYSTFTEVDQFSQEFKLSGNTEKLQWMAGLYYLDFDTDQRLHAPATLSFGTTPESILPYSVTTSGTIESESRAVFGHIEYDLTEQWTVTAALRYTKDERELKDHINQDTFGTILPIVFGLPDISVSIDDYFPELTSQDWDNYSAKLHFDWEPREDLLLFAGYTRGHKAGNFSLPVVEYLNVSFGSTEGLRTMPHDEEVLHSFEGGFKWTLAGGKAQLNSSVFYYDYEDYQASFFVDLGQIIDNVDATVVGAEIELTMSPLEGLDILLGLSVLDSEAEDITRTPFLPASDQPLPYSPDYTFNGLVRYEWPALGGSLAVQGDWYYTDDYCYTLICHPVEEEDSYLVGNVRISYTAADDQWSITGFVENVGDIEYRQYGLALESVITGVTNGFAPPRWWGATLRYNF